MFWRLVGSGWLLLATAQGVVAVDSLPGDADCDGYVLEADLRHLQSELADGDGLEIADVADGSVLSCSGADANDDGLVTAADLSALIAFLSGQGTAALATGPVITFLGTAGADGTVSSALGGVVPTFQHAGGLGFRLVIEVERGPSNAAIGQNLFNSDPNDPALRPDLEVLVSRELGDGSPAVCDEGGVPGASPPAYSSDQRTADALNDLSCRFTVVANESATCTINEFGIHRFVDSRTRLQFCLTVSTVEAFARGQTLVTARVRDVDGNAGVLKQFLVHIGSEPLPTLTVTRTRTVTLTPTRTGTTTPTPTSTALPSATPRLSTPTRSGTPTITRTRTPSHTPPPSPSRTASPAASATASRTGTRALTSTPTMSRTATRSPTRSASFTRTPTGLATGTAAASGTPSATRTRTPTGLATPTPSSTRTRTRTSTASPAPSVSPTRTRPATPTRTGTAGETATRTRTPDRTSTRTRTPSVTETPSRTPVKSPTRTGTITRTPTRTTTADRSRTATRTGSPTVTGSRTRTATRTSPPTATRTVTATVTGPQPPTATRTATAAITRTPTRTGTRTRTRTPTPPPATGTQTRTPTRTVTGTQLPAATVTATPVFSRTRTRTFTAGPSATPTRTATGMPTRTVTRTATFQISPTRTRTATTTRTVTLTPTVTRTATASPTASATRTSTVTRTPSRTGTITQTRTVTLTLTPSRTRTQTRTPTPTRSPGADISFVGLARPNDRVITPSGTTNEGLPIFERPFGYGFTVVVEGKRGPNNRPVGISAFESDPFNPSTRPDLQIIVSRPLGDGSSRVCDDELPTIGGIPAAQSFDETQAISNAINDLACRFVDGSGNPGGRGGSEEACTQFDDGNFRFVNPMSSVQFCAPIAPPFGFQVGDTLVTVRLRDLSGMAGTPAAFVVRVLE